MTGGKRKLPVAPEHEHLPARALRRLYDGLDAEAALGWACLGRQHIIKIPLCGPVRLMDHSREVLTGMRVLRVMGDEGRSCLDALGWLRHHGLVAQENIRVRHAGVERRIGNWMERWRSAHRARSRAAMFGLGLTKPPRYKMQRFFDARLQSEFTVALRAWLKSRRRPPRQVVLVSWQHGPNLQPMQGMNAKRHGLPKFLLTLQRSGSRMNAWAYVHVGWLLIPRNRRIIAGHLVSHWWPLGAELACACLVTLRPRADRTRARWALVRGTEWHSWIEGPVGQP
jgi:hypothetical protein